MRVHARAATDLSIDRNNNKKNKQTVREQTSGGLDRVEKRREKPEKIRLAHHSLK